MITFAPATQAVNATALRRNTGAKVGRKQKNSYDLYRRIKNF